MPVYRVYANFDNPFDQVVAVYGDDDEPMTVSSTNGFAQASGSSVCLKSSSRPMPRKTAGSPWAPNLGPPWR